MIITLTAFICLLATNECKSVTAHEHFISIEDCNEQIKALNDPEANEILKRTGIVVMDYTCTQQ